MSIRKGVAHKAHFKEESQPVDAAANSTPDTTEELAPLARTRRLPRRAKTERGLPADESLVRLARRYLEIQTKNWPKLVEVGLLASATDELVAEMVQDFKSRHQSGKIDHARLKSLIPRVGTLGGMYGRYSCDNSSDLSIDDQMAKILAKALTEGCFIPWCYVFCDYSVTGRDSSRQGYSSYKKILENGESHISGTYIDDFTRASRDEIEWWRLAALSKRLGKRLVGASDGFNLSDPNSDVMITIFGLVSRLFLKGLKEKVKRGMQGAAGRGTCLGKLSLGFTRRILMNSSGNAVYDADGIPTYDICIDPATRGDRLRIFEMFAISRLTSFEIARQFNAQSIDGWNGWTDSGIKSLLRNPNAIGVFIWNKTRREFNIETGKWKVVRNPRSEWTVNYRPELALVPLDLWRAARRRLAEMRRASPLTGRDFSRNQISATTLFSGTLFCESCGTELKLVRSTEKYKQMGCTNSLMRGHNCKLSASKSVKVIEECLLSYLRNVILTDSMMEQLVVRTNQMLAEESKNPAINTAPLKAEEKETSTKIAKLVRLIEDSEDKNLTSGFSKRITELEKRLQAIRIALRNANVDNARKPRPLQLDQAKTYLDSFRNLLQRDTAEAAEAIRMITGPIFIREEKISGRSRGARWIATFQPQWNKLLNHMANDGDGVPIEVAEMESGPVEVPIDKIPQYVTLAETFKRLHSQGSSLASIASAHGMAWKQANDILQFALTGERPKWGTRKRTGRGQTTAYVEIAAQVAELRDQKLSFEKIASQLNVSAGTVRRAYDHARPETVRTAAETSTAVHRGRFAHLSAETFAAIREGIDMGKKDRQIADEAGCSRATVIRARKELHSEDLRGKAG